MSNVDRVYNALRPQRYRDKPSLAAEAGLTLRQTTSALCYLRTRGFIRQAERGWYVTYVGKAIKG